MKKSFKRYLSLVMVLMVAFVCLFSVSVSAANVATSVDFTTKSATHQNYTDSWKYGNWTVSGGANNNGGWNYVKMGGKKDNLNKYNKIYISSPAVTVTTDKVEVNVIKGSLSKSGMTAKIKVEVYSDSTLKTLVDSTAEQTVTNAAKTFSFAPNTIEVWPANSYFKIVFNVTNTSSTNGIVLLDKVSIYQKGEEPSLEILGDSFAVVDGEKLELEANVKNSSSEVKWVTSDESVATVVDGIVTPVAKGTVTLTASLVDDETIKDTHTVTVYPSNVKELTIAEAIEVCEFTGQTNTPYKYVTTGKVKTIDTAYDAGYGNISVTITDGVSSIKVFRLTGGSDLKVGDTITVTGVLVNYYGNTPEFAQGCTYELVTDPVADIVNSLNNVESYMSLAYTYTPVEGEEGVYDSVFRIRCGIDFAIADIEGVESFGIKVATSEKEKEYDETSEFWAEDNTSEEQCYYVVIDLGNLFAADERFEIEFTVSAYVVVDGEIYYSEFEKTFSVAYLVAYYYETLKVEQVKPLYDLLLEMGKIE